MAERSARRLWSASLWRPARADRFFIVAHERRPSLDARPATGASVDALAAGALAREAVKRPGSSHRDPQETIVKVRIVHQCGRDGVGAERPGFGEPPVSIFLQ
jgi:hypothetical protein